MQIGERRLLIPYLDQLEMKARTKGIALATACQLAGLPDSTIWRWRNHKATPSEAVTRRVMLAIENAKTIAIPEVSDWHALIATMASYRRAAGYSQEALDHKLGTADGLVAKWECGMRRPTSFNLFCWGQALGVSFGIIPLRAAL
jgi:predicted DNA-binding transcriptional regulator AlpA